MINIKTYAVAKNNNSATNDNYTVIINNNDDENKFEPHYLWGQYFDDTEDIDGDLTSSGTITGNTINGTTKVISPKGEITQIDSATGNITNINSDLINTKNINVTVQAIIKLLQSENITCDNLTVTKAAHFFQLIIDEIKATQGQVIITPASAKIEKVTDSTNYICYWKATDNDKTVYNQFEVDDLVICQTFNLDKQSNLISDAKFTNLAQNWNASNTWLTADYTQASASGGVVSFIPQSRITLLAQKLNLQPNTQYNLSFEIKQDVASNSDVSVGFHLPVIDTTKPMKHNADDFVELTNTLQGFDFNLTDEYKRVSITFTTLSSLPSNANLEIYCYDRNTSGNVKTYITNPILTKKSNSNKYYWRKVVSTGTTTLSGESYNYIELSKTDYDTISNDVPEVGDEIVQLGNKTNTNRQAAIIISAYNNQFLDAAIVAPSIVQYSGINDYNLSDHRLNIISNGLNLFKGNFTSMSGDDLATLIQQTNNAITTEVTNRINGDLKYFPVLKPFYDSNFNIITDYKSNPIRYKGDADIYTTPTFLKRNTYNLHLFFSSRNVNNVGIVSYGTTFPNDLSGYDDLINIDWGITNNTIKCKDNTWLYEYIAQVTLTADGYYGFNFWQSDEYIYVPEMENEFETNYSRITQTANKISLSIYDALRRTGIDIENGTITLNADNTDIVGNLNLDDTGHGLTMYDTYNDTLNGTSYKIPKVNIQPSDISPYNSTAVGYNDMFDRLQWNFNSGVSATSSDSSYKYFRHELTFLSQSTTTISLNKNDMIVFKNSSCQCWKDSNSSVGSPYWLVEAYNQTTGNTYKCIPSYSYMTYVTTLQYNDTSTYKFNIPEAGTYKFYITLRFSSSNIGSSNLKGFFQCAWLRGSNIQTFMGNDGFYSRANPFTAIYSSKDETRLQNGLGGLRVRNNDTNLSGTPAPPRIEVGTTYAGSFPSVKPLWIPIWNYTPVHYVESTDYVWKTLYINNGSSSAFVYDVPANVNGMIVLNTAPMDPDGNYRDAWIRLPNTSSASSYTDSDGNSGAIPNGYTIKIINDLNVNVYVTPYRDSSSSTSNHTIRDANGNYNEYFGMNGEQNRVTSFIKLTAYPPYSTYWFADKDT